MKIKFLQTSTINRIAAGEVIERPASVVKELVENAIDAGATNIDIALEQSGKNLILISDNGSGMPAEDLSAAVERHATSKLNEEDLLDIHTFGFRGEALPSIGAISRMSITSIVKGSERAYRIEVIGGEKSKVQPAVLREGTRIEIRDLFFATPARLKFLKTDRTELSASLDLVKKIALAHPSINFTLTHDGKELLKLKSRNEKRQRFIDIIGEDFIGNSALLEFTDQDISISGYVGIPTFNRAAAEDQFFFVNNRPVRDKILSVALRVAYQDYLARDRHPVAAIFLQINPKLVDVNVHPAKSEVRFHDTGLIRNLLINAIKNALSAASHRTSTTIAGNAIGYFNPATLTPSRFTAYKEAEPGARKEPVTKVSLFEQPASSYKQQPLISIAPVTRPEEEAVQITTEPGNYPLGVAKAQLHNTYIVSQTSNTIIIVDQHAAHERLGYEKIKQTIEANGLIKQRLLTPEIVELPDEKRASAIFEQKEQLSKLGLTVERFGDKGVIVTEVPSLLGEVNASALINDLGDNLVEMGENIKLRELIEHVTETYACHYSIRAGKRLGTVEMNELLRQMEKTPFSGQCNHGRPTYIELKLKDIEKLFGRS